MGTARIQSGTLPDGRYRHEVPKRNGFGIWDMSDGGSGSGRGGVWIREDNVVKSRRVKVYDLPSGWYREQSVAVVKCRGCGHGECPSDGETRDKVSDYFCVTVSGEYRAVTSSAADHIADIVSGPVFGEDGCWNGSRCHCGNEVDDFTPRGFPRCADHLAVDEDGEDVVPF